MAEESWSAASRSDEADRLFGWNLSPKCVKRPKVDESSYSKPEPAKQADGSAKDSSNLRSLIAEGLKVRPFVRPRGVKTRPSRKRCVGITPAHQRQLDLLNAVQRDIDNVMQEKKNQDFQTGLRQLDELRPLLTKRFCVILGEYLDELSSNHGDCGQTREEQRREEQPSLGGPVIWNGFWLETLERCLTTSLMIYPWDREALSYLLDIRCTSSIDPPAFQLDFVFAHNPFFTNSILTRQFDFQKKHTNSLSSSIEHYQPVSTAGCTVYWLPDQNLTKRSKKAKIRDDSDEHIITCVKRSFFNFFDPIVTSNSANTEAEQTAFDLDFHIGNVIRTSLVPGAQAFIMGISKDPLYVREPTAGQHPARKAAAADINRRLTREELETLEVLWLKKDGHAQLGLQDREVDRHVQRGLERIGYRVRQGRAYRPGDVTTSGESSGEGSLARDKTVNGKSVTAKKRGFRGLLETNTVRSKRRHRGIKLTDIGRIVDETGSEDDRASLFDLQTDSAESFDSDVSLLVGMPGGGKRIQSTKTFGSCGKHVRQGKQKR
ncbi:putative nucleosome assembly protein [Hypsibius exemplaris]|uniref:Nucleosome assembly protein n=1 Tax=Hypsibius exemplaris TaxID=2072580 RepID=A0A1W0X460_HYPEX|nr:putative nucleosome assembly protein [Hypsibius exemplaris]